MAETLATLAIDIVANDRTFNAALAAAQKRLEAFERGFGKTPVSLPAPVMPKMPVLPDPVSPTAPRNVLALASAQARLLVTQGDLAGAAARLSGALQQVEAGSLAAVRGQTQLAQIQNRVTEAAGGSAAALARANSGNRLAGGVADGVSSSLTQLAGAFGIVTTGAAAAALAVQQLTVAFNLKASIDAGRASLGAFLGDQTKANAAFDAGAAFADQYALKQSEVAGALQSLAPLLRTSTTATEDQLEVLARLQSLNPAATFQDAAFSIKELASGDYASIADQFNLGNTAARALRDEVASGTDVFVALGAVLDRNGATVEALAVRTQGAVGAQNAATKATEDFQLALGTLVQGPGTALLTFYASAAVGATEFATRVSGAGNSFTEAGAAIAATAPSYAAYVEALNASNTATAAATTNNSAFITGISAFNPALGALIASSTNLTTQNSALTASQFAYVQALVATGASAEAATSTATAQAGALALIDTAVQGAGGALDAYSARLVSVAAAGQGELDAVQALVLAFRDGGLNADTFAAQLANLEGVSRANADAALALAAGQAAAAAGANSAASQFYAAAEAANADSVAKLAQAAAAELTAVRHDELAAAIEAAAASSGTAVSAANAIAAQFNGVEQPAVLNLINLHRQLAAARAQAAAPVSAAFTAKSFGGSAPADAVRSLEQARESQKAFRAEQVRLLQQASGGRFGLNVPAARAGGGGGGGGGGAAAATKAAASAQKKADDAAIKAAEARAAKLADITATFHEAQLAAETRYQDAQLAVTERYNEAQLGAQQDLQVTSAGSRADFYDSLSQTDLPADIAASLSGAYEAAFAEAQRLSQDGKAALAADYLALKQEQIAAEQKFQEAVQAAKEKGDKAEIARLTAIKALRDAEFQAKESNLTNAGDANVAALDTGLSDAERQRQEELAKASATAGDAAVAAQAKTAEAARLTNDEYQRQLDLLRQLPGGGAAPVAPATPSPAAPVAAPAAPGTPAADPSSVAAGLEAVRAQVAALDARVDRVGSQVAAALKARPVVGSGG